MSPRVKTRLILFSLSLLIIVFVYFIYNQIPQNIKIFINPSPTPIFVIQTPTIFSTSQPVTYEKVQVLRVVDGDTIELQDKRKVRYIGINTPETKDLRRKVQCFGEEAYQKNKKLVENKEVYLGKDVSETDKFGRLLRYVYLDNPKNNKGALFVNEYLVKEGYAQVSTFPPDVKYTDVFLKAEKYAQENKLGLWSKCF